MTIATYQWTIDRYHQAVEAGVFEDQAIELLKGELVLMSPEGTPHAYYSDRAARYLRRLLELPELAYVREAKPITLPNASEPEPDIAIVQPLDQIYLAHHPYPENVFWVIEYAQSSLTKDLEIKRKIYAEVNIAEYWVINLRDKKLIVFRIPVNGEYQSEVSVTSGVISPLSFPNIQIDVRQLMTV
ncbi:Uma2 family endonuclease [Leptolyngbya boryana CZ1]|uniref:Uma2 family endonuclease n=1 Tax=Leptolyngbya boryana CZ1 TaxID=3060204 RepID=A0AA97AP68_LEPBY|nr:MULTISPECIES: Uma2 family endonuclease [Leptolyngbya]MBD1857832.1 Uma2 family endonuclease [Leptolyngbya sp. FACHB-1624]WNZ44634.1 Uma2 family endonuclease [Leptolyngbya boryana CZ1]